VRPRCWHHYFPPLLAPCVLDRFGSETCATVLRRLTIMKNRFFSCDFPPCPSLPEMNLILPLYGVLPFQRARFFHFGLQTEWCGSRRTVVKPLTYLFLDAPERVSEVLRSFFFSPQELNCGDCKVEGRS